MLKATSRQVLTTPASAYDEPKSNVDLYLSLGTRSDTFLVLIKELQELDSLSEGDKDLMAELEQEKNEYIR